MMIRSLWIDGCINKEGKREQRHMNSDAQDGCAIHAVEEEVNTCTQHAEPTDGKHDVGTARADEMHPVCVSHLALSVCEQEGEITYDKQ